MAFIVRSVEKKPPVIEDFHRVYLDNRLQGNNNFNNIALMSKKIIRF